jgi:hypothetical protein
MQVTQHSWKEDARFVGAFVRGGDWEVGLRVARNVEVGAGEGGKPVSSDRISMVDFANEAGISKNTVAKYLAAWEWAADAGKVDPSVELTADDEYGWETAGLTEEDWKDFYKKACDNPPPWNLAAKPLEPRKAPGRHVGRQTIIDAIKSDPEIASAAREALTSQRENSAAERIIEEKNSGFGLLNASKEEIERRGLIDELSDLAEQISEKASTVASFGIIGVPEEVQSLRHISQCLTDAQWAVNASIAENFEGVK